MEGLDHDNHTAQCRQGEELMINFGRKDKNDILRIATGKNHAGTEATKIVSTKDSMLTSHCVEAVLGLADQRRTKVHWIPCLGRQLRATLHVAWKP
jgi:hypothetical protein